MCPKVWRNRIIFRPYENTLTITPIESVELEEFEKEVSSNISLQNRLEELASSLYSPPEQEKTIEVEARLGGVRNIF